MKIRTQNSQGFTLIELLVVIAIVGVLSGVVLQSLSYARIKSRDTSRLATIDQIQKAFELSTTLTGTNQLPATGLNTWICLGATANDQSACGFNFNATVNSILENAIANKIIPSDPHYASGLGTMYLYTSNSLPATTPVSTRGAFLSWVMEGTTNCGRGVRTSGVIPTNAAPNGTQCFLRIGNSI